MGFEFTKLYTETFDCEFKPEPDVPDGEGLQLTLNVDILTYDFLQFIRNMQQPAKKGARKKNWLDENVEGIEFMARILGGEPGETDPKKRVIVDWNMTNKGEKMEVSFEAFHKFGLIGLQKLFQFCVFEAAKPTKKTETQ